MIIGTLGGSVPLDWVFVVAPGTLVTVRALKYMDTIMINYFI